MALKLKTKTSKLKTAEKKKTKDINAIDEAISFVSFAHGIKSKITELEAQISNLKKELTPVEKQIVELVDQEVDSTESIDLIDENGSVLSVGARQQTRVIKDVEEVVDALEEFEEGLAIKIAKFNLGDLDKYFSPEEMAVLCQIKEGNRRLTYK